MLFTRRVKQSHSDTHGGAASQKGLADERGVMRSLAFLSVSRPPRPGHGADLLASLQVFLREVGSSPQGPVAPWRPQLRPAALPRPLPLDTHFST